MKRERGGGSGGGKGELNYRISIEDSRGIEFKLKVHWLLQLRTHFVRACSINNSFLAKMCEISSQSEVLRGRELAYRNRNLKSYRMISFS